MSLKINFFVLSILTSIFLWYLHEFYKEEFIQVSRNIPYLSFLMIKVHSFLKTEEKTDSKINERLFTKEELSFYSGNQNDKGLYISILGKVYDVKKGKKHYSPGSGYHIFAGRDASRAFITGDFTEEGASDQVLDLNPRELLSLMEWIKFYNSNYVYKGKLIGTYYDKSGQETMYLKKVQSKCLEGRKEKVLEQQENIKFPPCNAEWSATTGTRVWCSNQSGGIDRNWIGVPRKLYEVGSENYKCVCINLEELKDKHSAVYAKRGLLRLYDDCENNAISCYFD